MLIPNSEIVISAANNAGSVKIQPEYYGPLYSLVWSSRLANGEGVKVTPLSADAHPSARYHEIESVDAEYNLLCALFKQPVVNQIYPTKDSLRAAIKVAIEKDLDRVREIKERPAPVADQSFLDAGVDADTAIRLQEYGINHMAKLAQLDVVDLMAVRGMEPLAANSLIDKAKTFVTSSAPKAKTHVSAAATDTRRSA
jgi:hypothetical protein